MSILLIHRLARKSHEKTRRELTGSIWVHRASAALALGGIFIGINVAQRAACAVALVWCIAGASVYQRGMRAEALSGDAGLESGISFLRRELQRRRDLFGRWLVWGIGPVLFTLAAAVVPLLLHMAFAVPEAVIYSIPSYAVLVSVFFTGIIVERNRKKRELQKELDDLNEIERDNR